MPTDCHYSAIRQILADNLKVARRAKNFTQETLADKSGLAIRHLQKIEAAEVNVTLGTIAKIAKALRVSVHTLFELRRQ
jgi:transcriptional regulator with XRE-family HTH domain